MVEQFDFIPVDFISKNIKNLQPAVFDKKS